MTPQQFTRTHEGLDPAELATDQGDGLEPEFVCSFLAGVEPSSAPCPQEVVRGGHQVLSGLELPACPFHVEHGGWLSPAARLAHAAHLIAELNREAAASALRLDPDGSAHLIYPTHCSGCGSRIFTGNRTGLCSECS